MKASMHVKRNANHDNGHGHGHDHTDEGGLFVLENAMGETVRSFHWESSRIAVVFRRDNRRVETFASVKELEESEISFELIADTTVSEIRKKALIIPGGARLRFVEDATVFSRSYELPAENNEEAKRIAKISAIVQVALIGLIVAVGSYFGKSEGPKETTVTLLPQQVVDKMLQEQMPPPHEPLKAQQERAAQRRQPEPPARPVKAKDIVVAPSLTKITKNTPVPTRSTSFKKSAKHSKGPRGGGYKGEGPRGYGTNESNMNSIGALGALDNAARVRGGNGGRGGLNLQAVGTEPGSGAGGKGFGGFGRNGGGGKGLGGLGTGKGMGLSNAMYGKGLIAAPFGDGSPAPGAGGYGTRGKAGGGAQGAGYGTETIVGSWKGTGPKGNGPAGSGVGNGDPNGSPYGLADGDDNGFVVTGGLDQDQIAEVIARNMGQITYCYEQGLQKHESLSGRVTVRWQINGRGRVDSARVVHSSLRSGQVESCIAGKIRGWAFPKPQGGVNVAVTKPFLLRRVSQR